MAQREKGGRVVFIGNIPYGISEEQIMDIFGRCGQVMGFRLVYDKETGQPKGFGFLEYSDTDAAASAVRNLNDFDLNGRTLRVDYSNDNRATNNQAQSAADSNRAPAAGFGAANGKVDPAALPPIPPGIDLPAGVTALDAISTTLRQVPAPQLLEFISQLKTLCANNPQQATALLASQPQLGYAVFQAMVLMGLVDPNIVGQLVSTTQAPVQAQPPQQPPPPTQYQYAPAPQYPQYGAPAAQQQYGAPAPYGQPYAPTPPQQTAYQPPPGPQPPVSDLPDDQKALMDQVLALSKEEIYALDPNTRDQIILLRAQRGIPT